MVRSMDDSVDGGSANDNRARDVFMAIGQRKHSAAADPPRTGVRISQAPMPDSAITSSS